MMSKAQYIKRRGWIVAFTLVYLCGYMSFNAYEKYGSQGGPVPSSKEEDLYFSSKKGDKGRVLSLIEEGVLVDSEVSIGQVAAVISTPLEAAILNNHYDIVELLVTHGADLDLVNKRGRKPIHIASLPEVTDPRILSYLIEKGANINEADAHGLTPIHYAVDIYMDVDSGETDMNLKRLDILLDSGVEIDAIPSQNSPVFRAITNSNDEALKKLVEYGFSLNHKNENGLEPVQLASASLSSFKEKFYPETEETHLMKLRQGYIDRYQEIYDYLLNHEIDKLQEN